MDLGLARKVAVVTGSSRGIGAVIALAFASEGAHVAVHYRVSEKEAGVTASCARKKGVRAETFQADVSKSDDVVRLFEEVQKTFGTVDILVNNAATILGGPTLSFSDKKYRLVMGSQLDGAFFCTREALKIMTVKCSGKIVNIASVVGQRRFAETAAYSAAKAGVIGLTRSVAVEVAPLGVNVNAVAPGYTESPLVAGLSQSDLGRRLLKSHAIPSGRLGTMSEVASAVLFLASQHANYFVGEVLTTAGGL